MQTCTLIHIHLREYSILNGRQLWECSRVKKLFRQLIDLDTREVLDRNVAYSNMSSGAAEVAV